MTKLFNKAKAFVHTCYQELGMEDKIEERLAVIKQEIEATDFYEHTFIELEHGAKMAWRNANKCIGRLFWQTLTVRDARLCTDEEGIFDELRTHLRLATNGGKIKPMMTFFAPRKQGKEPVRVLNHQLVRYAGYEEEGTRIIGDPASLALTKLCESLGWQGEQSAFDVLPLVIKLPGGRVKWRDLPKNEVLRVPIRHPDTDKLDNLQLEWYAVPAITDMMVEIGGIEYPTVPFNGWYMGTEIGARNFADEKRYDLLPQVAKALDLDKTKTSSLWKDKALVELNRAVLYSFQQKGVSIVDHHTAAEQFKQFEKREKASGRPLTGTWSWLIPPMSPAATHIFHQNYQDELLSPNFHYQERLFQENGCLK
ncbi:nitric oxide synthase oxygenase [Salipaludibacillus sp. LMS25]|jgi:nitric-oxide synthase|uniref:nitric oxide synthase oxygenase n=1 Tax=Salipaludibacillus sp. LMS25 TaxID=2924031 RepID=UPI0020D08C49|nr:nitric oxide synthase oxygenase [Salipaludibacillus sp. LMS25]UTR13897.1 nitric oxide synthase oxygenase [Salipaludibacillus sp. LMS25]